MNLTLNDRLAKAIENKRLKSKLEGDLQAVEKELEANTARLSTLRTRLEKEQVDVERLEGTNLTSLFARVLGSREEQLAKERQELLSAQLRYQQARRQLENLAYDRDRLTQKLTGLADAQQAYQAILSEKERYILGTSHPVARELLGLTEKIAGLKGESNELGEAIAAGEDALLALDGVVDSLGSAESWGVWDMLGGGILSSAIKHARVDDAREQIAAVQAHMNRFQRELADVQRNADLSVQISDFDRFADFILDGLIFDWVVQAKIVDSLQRCKQTKTALQEVLSELESQQEGLKAQLQRLENQRNGLIEQG